MMVSGGWAARRGRSALVALLLGALALLGAVEGYTEEMLVQGVDGAALVRAQQRRPALPPLQVAVTCAAAAQTWPE